MTLPIQPMTVAQLIERLKQFDPDAAVMIGCEDHYYEGPLAEICIAKAGLTGAYDYLTPAEDERGKRVPRRQKHYPGGDWVIIPEYEVSAPIVERRPCIVLRSKS